jgi:hypothetical protein
MAFGGRKPIPAGLPRVFYLRYHGYPRYFPLGARPVSKPGAGQ